MDTEVFGGVRCPIASPEVGESLLRDAEAHLRTLYTPGVYREGVKINEMIQYHFGFFAARLDQTLPKVASREFMEFILYMYDLTTSIQQNVDNLSEEESHRWQERGPCLRRSLKYLAECVCLLRPTQAPDLTSEKALRRIEEALFCADMMIRVSITSERTHGLFPQHSSATIYPPGGAVFFRVDVEDLYSDYETKGLARTLLDNELRPDALGGPPFDLDPVAIEATLNPAFTASFDCSFYNFISILKAVIEGFRPNGRGFPVPFVPIRTLVEQFASQGIPELTTRRIFAGFSISPDKLKSDGRVIWKPQQQSRAHRRAFFEFPHTSGEHLCFSKGMALESIVHLVQGTSFQKLPTEWRTEHTKAALDVLSNQAGIWFENKVKERFNHFGVRGARVKKSLGQGAARVSLPVDCGEIDFLGYSERERLLVIAEFKMVNPALEPKFWRDDVTAFVGKTGSYASKFRKKIYWVLNNRLSVEAALNIHYGEARGLGTVMVTLYPTMATIFLDDFPCVTVTEFASAYKSAAAWPYNQGLHYW